MIFINQYLKKVKAAPTEKLYETMKTLINRPERARMLPLARKETKETLLNRSEMIKKSAHAATAGQ